MSLTPAMPLAISPTRVFSAADATLPLISTAPLFTSKFTLRSFNVGSLPTMSFSRLRIVPSRSSARFSATVFATVISLRTLPDVPTALVATCSARCLTAAESTDPLRCTAFESRS
jgi:hypothetical protein